MNEALQYHIPVMLNEALSNLLVNKGRKYIDCTIGDGGHALEIVKKGGNVLGIDINDGSISRSKERYSRIKKDPTVGNLIIVKSNFNKLEEIAKNNDFSMVNGIIMDLGFSSLQLSDTQIGLSFSEEQPLDMRLDQTTGVTATDLVNYLDENRLTKIIKEYSGEKNANLIAKKIIERRNLKKFQTTKDLSDLIRSAVSPGYEHGRIHPATRTFQALRIAVNGELENLEKSLPQAARLLLPGGRLVVISFHSLEDKITKQFGHDAQPMLALVYKKPITATLEEIRSNPRSRSAKMRVFEKKI